MTPIAVAEGADRFRREAAAADAGEGRHARIVPAVDVLFLHELQQLALAEQRVGEVEAVEFDLLRRKDAELLDDTSDRGADDRRTRACTWSA